MAIGYLNFILHAHLPYLRHPGNPLHVEQRWLYESIVESYLPLIDTLDRLTRKDIRFHITLSLSPPLGMMLADPHHQDNCEEYLRTRIELADYACRHHRTLPRLAALSRRYRAELKRTLSLYSRRYRRDLIGALLSLRNRGTVSLIPSSVSHAYLPVLEEYPAAVVAQVRGGQEVFQRITGTTSEGFWLPECGYSPEIEQSLARAGVRFSVVDAHAVVFSKPRAPHSVYRPVIGPSGTILFGRDAVTSRLIWSAETGYPADPDYRDFYADLAYELPEEAVRTYVHPDGLRVPSGLKYRRVTGREDKDVYDPARAAAKAELHAAHFIRHVGRTIARVQALIDTEPVITVAFDAELFGHWWYEGCAWLENVLTGCSRRRGIRMRPWRNLAGECTGLASVVPERSSWGAGGYHETWINPSNDAMLRQMRHATETLLRLVRRGGPGPGRATTRALNAAAAELFLLQASDWAFLADRGTSSSYAVRRSATHYDRVMRIARMVEKKKISLPYLRRLEREQGPFACMDHRWLGVSVPA